MHHTSIASRRLSILNQVQTLSILQINASRFFGAADVEPPIAEGWRGPALASQDIRSRKFDVFIRAGRDDDDFSGIRKSNDFVSDLDAVPR
ncbi:hypothetical protein N9N28_11190, partial [Rubripirellula amarantea]|nr:hypothetical protein [Rubripirellula amarantea]